MKLSRHENFAVFFGQNTFRGLGKITNLAAF